MSRRTAPRISIICPLHNKGPYIGEAIESVLGQTESNWEMVVVENNSTDGGPSCVARFHDNRIQLLDASADARGPGAARNIGLEVASGNWVLFLDADDAIAPEYLAMMLSHAASGVDVVAAPWKEYLASAFLVGEPVIKQPAGITAGGKGLEQHAIAFTCWAVHAAIVRRKRLANRRWPQELDGYLAEDTAFWYRVIEGARVVYASEAGAYYRTHTEGCRSDFTARVWFEGNHRAVMTNLDWIARAGKVVTPPQMESLLRLYQDLYARATLAGDKVTAKAALSEATEWLSRLRSSGASVSPSIYLRSILGIPAFERIRCVLS